MTGRAEGSRRWRGRAGLNRAVLDAAPGELLRQLGYECAWYGSTLVVADRGSNAAANPACLAESVETIGTASGAGTGQGDPLANAQGEERCMGSPMCSSANCEDGASVELDRTVTATRQQVAPKPEPVPVGSDRRDRRDRIGNGTRLAAAGRIWTDPAVGPARSRP